MSTAFSSTSADGGTKGRIFRAYSVIPTLPPRLERLRDIAFNVWWTWEPGARELFIRLDRDLWESQGQSPIRVLANVSQERLEELTEDDSYLAHLDRIAAKFDYYRSSGGWFAETHGRLENGPVAYFSMEFGLHNSLPLYSGGLGVLAGDHLKASSDLGVPLVGVGIFYRNGYFHQYLNSDGWQQEKYPEMTTDELPLRLARTPDKKPVRVSVQLPGRRVFCQVWQVEVGRISLYLLDSNVAENNPDDRNITAKLYSGGQEMRVAQEKILGVGGLQALREMGITPAVCHMNEGHSAFLGAEWIRWLIETTGTSFEAARQAVIAGSIFTTHTPVPAGNDEFPAHLIRDYFADYVPKMKISMEQFLQLGQAPGSSLDSPFSMTLLAIRLSSARNGVSQLHGEVSRRMWKHVWPELSVEEFSNVEEVPIGAITNGVHLRTWLSGEFEELFDRYLGPKWVEDPDNPKVWERVKAIPDTELWRAHERRRERLVARARRRLRNQLIRRGAPAPEIEAADEVLDPMALTVGFARRFATYKRATLLFADRDRLAKILTNPERPVQMIFSGKAHPRDDAGKDFIREIVHIAREEPFRQHIVFLEDYEMNIARYLVQGADVWLNTPRRPLEASGTSGMKAAANGVLNLSILDGWWVEGYEPDQGWAIGSGEVYDDVAYQDQVESEALYDVLEHEIVPVFYDRGRSGLPREWLARMKNCVSVLAPRFSMDRMVKEYVNDFYVSASRNFVRLTSENMTRAANLSGWLDRVRGAWDRVKVDRVAAGTESELPVGSELEVRAEVTLGDLKPEDVAVQLYYGRLGANDSITEGRTEAMRLDGALGDGRYAFKGVVPCEQSGRHAFAVRVMPSNEDLPDRYQSHLVRWG